MTFPLASEDADGHWVAGYRGCPPYNKAVRNEFCRAIIDCDGKRCLAYCAEVPGAHRARIISLAAVAAAAVSCCNQGAVSRRPGRVKVR
jgi:hypothetical protein